MLMKRFFISMLIISGLNTTYAQNDQVLITFEDPALPGAQMDYTQTIDTGDFYFDYYYQSPWGDYNRFYGRKNADSSYKGFTYSNIRDSVTPGVVNDRAAFPAIGNNGSDQYVVGHGDCGAHMTALIGVKPTLATTVFGAYLTNATCTVLSLEQGDSIAKKFGGPTGTDPDWLLLTIKGYYLFDSMTLSDSVLFYLADFRSDTSDMDYIIKDWTFVDLSSLGFVDSLSFSLSSSDTNQSGAMNTPAYFCIDDMGIQAGGSIDERLRNNLFAVYPNPAENEITVRLKGDNRQYDIAITNAKGEQVFHDKLNNEITIPSKNWAPGVYWVNLHHADLSATKKIIIRK